MNEGRSENGNDTDTLKPILEPIAIKAFVAGIIVGNLNKGLLLGFTVGALAGVFLQQNNRGIPDVYKALTNLYDRWNKSGAGSKT